MLYDVKICYAYIEGSHTKNLIGYERGTWIEILNDLKHTLDDDANVISCYIVEAINVETHEVIRFV